MKKQIKKQQSFDYLLKTIIIGDSGVGKSNILLRYSQNKFAENYIMTIGINFMYKLIEIQEIKMKLQIWDTAGQDKYKTITQSYYNGSNGVIVAYSVQSKHSFNAVKNWISDLKQKVKNNCQIVLIANKCDLVEREVSYQQGKKLGEYFNIPFYECSAKTGVNIQQAFFKLAALMKQNIIDYKSQNEQSIIQESKRRVSGSEALQVDLKKKLTKTTHCNC